MGYYIKVEPDVKIYVEDLNPQGKDTILFLHGWPGSHELFEYQFDALSKMGFRCIGLDMRGFGKSDKPLSGYNYDRLADDVRGVIETLKLNDITLAGHSTGGAIAVRYMARHNGYGVSKLALAAAAVPSVIERPYFPYGAKKETINDLIRGTLDNRPKMLKGFGDVFFYRNVGEPFLDWFFKLGLQAAGWATAAVAETWLDEESLFNDLTKIEVPTIILHSIHDEVCLFPLAEAMKKGIKNSKLVVFENSGHALFYEEKEKFNKELVEFIKG